VAAAGIERIREMCAARCTKGFVDGGRATREFSRVAVPWRGKLKVAADFRYGVWAGDVELAWENVHVGSQRLLPLCCLCSVSQSVSSRPPHLFVLGLLVGIILTAHRRGG